MFGDKKETVRLDCSVCHKPQFIMVDLEDVERAMAERSKNVMGVFVDREGKPYVTPAEAEMFISKTCDNCWKLLCPDDDLAYN